MLAKEEPNWLFGGMASPSWFSDKEGKQVNDEKECSWLFKMEIDNNTSSSQRFYLDFIVTLH